MDTSALLKLFVLEKGSVKMLHFASTEDDRNKIVCTLTQVEATSAICRLRKENRMSPAEATLALNLLANEARRLVLQPINTSVHDEAMALIDRHYLRALDALQLGSAIVARDRLAVTQMRLIASDKGLKDAALAEGFEVWDPCD
nr:type II toxin-antitoxin system VapC family toxin [Granulicella rosea]